MIRSQIIEWAQAEPWGVDTADICTRTEKTVQELGDTFEELKDSGTLVGLAGRWMTPERFVESSRRLESVLQSHHAESPAEPGHPAPDMVREAEVPLEGKILDRWLMKLSERRVVRYWDSLLALYDFRLQLSPRQDKLLARIEAELALHGFHPPEAYALAKVLSIPLPAVREILRLGAQAGRLIDASPTLYFLPSIVADAEVKARELGEFSASEYRDALASTRKYAVPLIEYFDLAGITERVGDRHRVKG